MSDHLNLPENLPRPIDDGADAHLTGVAMATVRLIATDGATVDLSGLGAGATVIYIYAMTGRPGIDLPDGWNEIPGARGCTPLKLPTFDVDARTLYRRLTLVIAGGHVEHAFYPVYPPDEHAGEVLGWLRDNNALRSANRIV